MKNLKVIAFDADDTLWHSEHMFQDVQDRLSAILDQYAPHEQVQTRLHETEVNNIRLFGYGVKGFTLSMIETAIDISRGTISAPDIHEIVMLGKGMLDAPLNLIDGCADVLETLVQLHRKTGNMTEVVRLEQRVEEIRVHKRVAYAPIAKAIP